MGKRARDSEGSDSFDEDIDAEYTSIFPPGQGELNSNDDDSLSFNSDNEEGDNIDEESKEDSLDQMLLELDQKEKAFQKRTRLLNRAKGELKKMVEEEGLEDIPVSQGGLKPDVEATVQDDFVESDSEEIESKAKFDQELEERLMTLNEKEKEEKEKIEAFERELLGDKHWSLKGEVNSDMRPKDSLLDVNMELPFFAQPRAYEYEDHLSKTGENDEDDEEGEEGTREDALEKEINRIIRKRIQNELFDDVEKKDISELLPQDKAKEDGTGDTLSFEKAKLGLGEMYGEEFKEKVLRLPTAIKTVDDQRKVKIAELVSELMTTLDNISNDHFMARGRYTKKGFNLLKTEASPLSMRKAKAPEEVAAPEFEVEDKADMSKEERRALRRAQKQRRKKLKSS